MHDLGGVLPDILDAAVGDRRGLDRGDEMTPAKRGPRGLELLVGGLVVLEVTAPAHLRGEGGDGGGLVLAGRAIDSTTAPCSSRRGGRVKARELLAGPGAAGRVGLDTAPTVGRTWEPVTRRLAAALIAASLAAVAGPLFAQPVVTPATVAPGDNLVVEGIPAIPAAIAEAANRYAEFRFAAMLDWHPVRREMLISTRFAEAAQVHLVRQPGGARTQLTFFPDRVAGARYGPRAGGDYFIFGKDVGGGEWYQIYRFDVATGAITLLTDGTSRNAAPGSRARATASPTPRPGARAATATSGSWTSPIAGRTGCVQVQGGGWRAVDWAPGDRHLLVEETLSANQSRLWVVEVASGARRLLTPDTGAEVAYGGGRFTRDGRGVFVTTDRDSEWSRLTLLDVDTGAPTYLTSDIPWDVDEFEISPDGRTVAFVTNEDGVSRLHLYDVERRRHRPVPGLPAGLLGGLRFHANGRDLGFTLNFARAPSDAYSLDTRTARLTRWTQSETGGLDAERVPGAHAPPVAHVRWQDPVRVPVRAGPEALPRPAAGDREHPRGSGGPVAAGLPRADELLPAGARRGRRVPERARLTGYGKTFLKLDNGFNREDTYRDVAALFDWIGEQPGLDPARIMVTGGSYGGYMAWASAAFHAATGSAARCRWSASPTS